MALGVRTWVLILIGVALVPGVLAATYLHLDAREGRIQEAQRVADIVVAQRVTAQQEYLESLEGSLGSIAAAEPIRHRSAQDCDGYLAGLMAISVRILDYAVYDMNGTLECAASPRDVIAPADVASLVVRAAATDAYTLGEYRLDSETRRPYLMAAVPVPPAPGEGRAFLVAKLSGAWLQRDAHELAMRHAGVFVVLDDAGIILIHEPNPERLVGRSVRLDHPLIGLIFEQEDGYSMQAGPDGVPRYYSFARLPGDAATAPAYLVYGIPEAAVLVPAQQEFVMGLILTGGLAILVFGIAWGGSEKRIVRPLAAMTCTAERLAGGDLTARTTRQQGTAELERLSRTLNKLASSFQTLDTARVELVNNTAHRLRTPLTSLLTAAEILGTTRGAPNEHTQRAVELIRRNSERLRSDMETVLDVARLQANEHLTMQELDLVQLAEEAAGSATTHGRVPISFHPSPADAAIVRGNPRWLRTAIMEYIENGQRLTPEDGDVRLGIRTLDDSIEFTVSDTGRGFTQADREQLFAAFGHADAARTETETGLGLGLYLVRLIIEHHGGRVWAESPGPGKGATFGFSLPRVVPGAGPSSQGSQDDAMSRVVATGR